jgi:hypothetical protein
MSDKMPPLTLKKFKEALGSGVVYAYIGEDGEVGWDAAQLAEGLLGKTRVFLVEDREDLAEWIGAKKPRGVIFGTDGTLRRLLDQAETEDLQKVIDALEKASA